ncbi:MAG: 50S ribosomal protein L20, partial [bacterium]
MPRVKRGVPGAKRRKKVLKRAKGFWGGRSKLFSVAT